jgi:hypothetical protein
MKAIQKSIIFCLALFFSSSAHATLITNGSFENGAFSGNSQDVMTLATGSTSLTGWTILGPAIAWIGPTNPFLVTAQSGSYFLDLTDYTPFANDGRGVMQTIQTNAGLTYTLRYYLSAQGPNNAFSEITATAGSTSQACSSTSTLWRECSMNFTATGPSTEIRLVGTNGQDYIGLDNVSVTLSDGQTPVPEPATYLPAGMILVSLARLRRR